MEQGPSVGWIGIPNEVGSPGRSWRSRPSPAGSRGQTSQAQATLQDENGTDGGH